MTRIMKMTLTTEFSDGTSLTLSVPTEDPWSGLPPYGDNPRFLAQQAKSGMTGLTHGLAHVIDGLYGFQTAGEP